MYLDYSIVIKQTRKCGLIIHFLISTWCYCYYFVCHHTMCTAWWASTLITHKHSPNEKKNKGNTKTNRKTYAQSLTPFCTYSRRLKVNLFRLLFLLLPSHYMLLYLATLRILTWCQVFVFFHRDALSACFL